jgi:hypothetical protein
VIEVSKPQLISNLCLSITLATLAALGCSNGDNDSRFGSRLREKGSYVGPQTANDNNEAASHFASALKDFRAAGFAWTADELPKPPQVDDQQNAATYLQTVIQKVDPALLTDHAPDGASLSEYWLLSRRVKRIMGSSEWPGIAKLLDQAAAQPSIDFHHDWTDPDVADYPELTLYSLFVKLLCTEAEQAAENHHGALAAKFLNEAWSLAVQLPSALPIGSSKVSADCAESVCNQLEKCVSLLCPDALRPNPQNGLSVNGSGLPQVVRFSNGGLMVQTVNGRTMVTRSLGSFPTTPPNQIPNPNQPKPTAVPVELLALRSNLRMAQTPPSFKRTVLYLAYCNLMTLKTTGNASTPKPPPLTDEELATSTGVAAKVTRMLQFWVENKKTFDRLDADPVGASESLDKSLDKFRKDHASSHVGSTVGLTGLPELGASRLRIEQRKATELALLDSVIQWCTKGVWSTSSSQVSGSGQLQTASSPLQIQGFGSNCTVTYVGTGDDTSQNFGQMNRLTGGYRRSSGTLYQTVPKSPVIASFPPAQTPEDTATQQDETTLENLPRPDTATMAAKSESDYQAYLARGLPKIDSYEGDFLDKTYIFNLYQADKQVATNVAHTTTAAVDPAPWLRLFPQVHLEIPRSQLSDPFGLLKNVLLSSACDYSIGHSVVIHLCRVYGSLALEQANKGDGAAAASNLDKAWHTMDMLRDEPVQVAASAADFCGMQVCSDIEKCASILFKKPSSFASFESALKCDGDPISLKRFFLAEIPSQASEVRGNSPRGTTDDLDPRMATEFHRVEAENARQFEFWTAHRSLIDNLDDADQSSLRTLEDCSQTLMKEHRTSFDTLKTDLNNLTFGQDISFAASYYLRDAEKILVHSMSYRLKNGVWPSQVNQLDSKLSPLAQSRWHLGSPQGSISYGGAGTPLTSVNPGDRFEVYASLMGPNDAGSAPLLIQRNAQTLQGSLVASYPPLEYSP